MIHPCLREAVGESQTVVTALNDDVTEYEIHKKNLWKVFKIKTLKHSNASNGAIQMQNCLNQGQKSNLLFLCPD